MYEQIFILATMFEFAKNSQLYLKFFTTIA